MKKATKSFLSCSFFLVAGLFFMNIPARCQDTAKEFPSLPDNVYKIVSFSCVPCHTSTGGLMSREKLNFTKWADYSISKQKEKAEKMYTELKKGAMPPKNARETRPEIIPTADQVDIIKKWAESLPDEDKK
jgi:hypothetical protein